MHSVGIITEREKKQIEKLIKKAGYAIGQKQETFDSTYKTLLTDRTFKIINDRTHPLHDELNGRINDSGRMRQLTIKTNRYRNSFLPSAIAIHNDNHSRSSQDSFID